MTSFKEEIQATHDKQVASMRSWLDGRKYYTTMKAMELVKGLEVGYRKDGVTPKFDHQLSVVRLLRSLEPGLMDPELTLTVAFLHDLMEDHPDWTFSKVEQEFTGIVAHNVYRLSKKLGGVTKTTEAYFTGLARSPVSSAVKLADRIHNVSTMQGVFSIDKQKDYIQEVRQRFFPMAKAARRLFPEQYAVYENLQLNLKGQCSLIKHIHEASEAKRGL